MHVRCLRPFPDTRPLSDQLRGNRVIRWSRRQGAGGELACYPTRDCKPTAFTPPAFPPSIPLLILSFQSCLFFLSFSFPGGSWCWLAAAKQVKPLQLKLPVILKLDDESAVSFRKGILSLTCCWGVVSPPPPPRVLRAAGWWQWVGWWIWVNSSPSPS